MIGFVLRSAVRRNEFYCFDNCYFQITVWDNVDLCYMNISDIPTFIEQSNCQRVLAEIVRSRRLELYLYFQISLNLPQLQPRGRDVWEEEAARVAAGQSLLRPRQQETVQDTLA